VSRAALVVLLLLAEACGIKALPRPPRPDGPRPPAAEPDKKP
jgi:hypothetical protein